MTSQSTAVANAARQLKVFINTTYVGDVRENNGLWQFQYVESWLFSAITSSTSPLGKCRQHTF